MGSKLERQRGGWPVEQQISKTLDQNNRAPMKFEMELTMVGPAWVQDNSPERVAQISEADAIEAANMGIGWRFEQLLRGERTFTLNGETQHFRAVGLRIKRQIVRPLSGFRGHCWQSAGFADGSLFGYLAYKPRPDGSQYLQKWHDA
jgi:hypothetical protein